MRNRTPATCGRWNAVISRLWQNKTRLRFVRKRCFPCVRWPLLVLRFRHHFSSVARGERALSPMPGCLLHASFGQPSSACEKGGARNDEERKKATTRDVARLSSFACASFSLLFVFSRVASMSVFSRGHHTAVPHPQSQHTFVEVPSPAGTLCALCQCVLFTTAFFFFHHPHHLSLSCSVSLSHHLAATVRISRGCFSRATSAPSAVQCCTRTATSSLRARSSVPVAAAPPCARSGPRAVCGASTSRSRATTTFHRLHRRPLLPLTRPWGRPPRSTRRRPRRACRRTLRAVPTAAGVQRRRLPRSHRL